MVKNTDKPPKIPRWKTGENLNEKENRPGQAVCASLRELRIQNRNSQFPFGCRGGLQAARSRSPCRAGSYPAVQICVARYVPGSRNVPGRRTRRPYIYRKTGRFVENAAPAGRFLRRGQDPALRPSVNCEQKSKIANFRSVVGAACRPPGQFYLVANAGRCCRVPVFRRAGS